MLRAAQLETSRLTVLTRNDAKKRELLQLDLAAADIKSYDITLFHIRVFGQISDFYNLFSEDRDPAHGLIAKWEIFVRAIPGFASILAIVK